jgi:single-stranded-DNA-specific exonuclease
MEIKEKKWEIKKEDSFQGIFEDLEPITEKFLRQLGISSKEEKESFLNPDYEKNLYDPFLLEDMDKAVERTLTAVNKKEKICIFGDYDADGVTSSSLLKSLFDQLEVDNFCYIPDRNKEGYGINKKAVDYIKKQKADLVITVDCGVSNFQEVDYIKKQKIDIIVLDHHYVPEKIPRAIAVVDPKRKDGDYPDKNLAGVGVTFKFAQALVSKITDFDNENLKWFLDLVAIGTIADCVPLLKENRIMTKFGLIVLSKTKRIGLKHLFKVGKINIDESNLPTSQQVAFQIAPRINAAGRMDHANIAYELINNKPEEDAKARDLALDLESQNQRRQKVTKQVVDEVEKRVIESGKMGKIIIEKSPHWELGIIGLAAGKIADKFQRPTILLNEKDDFCRGSGRSIESFNLIEALTRNKDLFEKYGGHSQAAGLTIGDKNLGKFKKTMEKEMENISLDELAVVLEINSEISFSEINDKLLRELSLLEPYGEGNRQPVFSIKNAELVDKKLVGKKSSHLKIWISEAGKKGRILEGIGFNLGEKYSQLKIGKKIEVAFNLEEDSWNGNKKTQMMIIDLKQQ